MPQNIPAEDPHKEEYEDLELMDLPDEDEDFDYLYDTGKTYGEEEEIDDVDPEDLDIYPSVVTSGMTNTLHDWEQYTDTSPDLSADDIDADWQGANIAGEETSGGSVPTPDQDIVEDIAEPWGMTYAPNEELDAEAKREELEHDRDENEGWGGI